jgi:hypothetical protein
MSTTTVNFDSLSCLSSIPPAAVWLPMGNKRLSPCPFHLLDPGLVGVLYGLHLTNFPVSILSFLILQQLSGAPTLIVSGTASLSFLLVVLPVCCLRDKIIQDALRKAGT